MSKEIKGYIKAEAIVAAAFNLFINGMLAALIYHKTDYVPAGAVSILIDLAFTCLLIFVLTALFSRASVKRTKTIGVLETGNRMIRFMSKLFRRPVLFGLVMGVITAVILSALTVPVFVLLGIEYLPFGVYILLKCAFTALLGGGATALELYAGMCKS